MGKAQSKRSVDITTEVVAEEGTGRVEKIEDVDQLKPSVNGDTQHNDSDNQKGEAESAENEKDLATEKNKPQTEPSAEKTEVSDKNGEGDSAPAASNGQDETLNESKSNETAEATAAQDSSKKTKKEKLKKKWSFRSISFGKKDKQKPVKKTEEKAEASKEEENTTTEVAAETNGECETVPENKIAEENKTEEKVALPISSETPDDTKNDVKPSLNGDSEQTPQNSEQKVEEVAEENKINEKETVALNGAKEEIQEPIEVPSADKVVEEGIKLNGNVSEHESSKIEVNTKNDIITDPPTDTNTNTSAQTPPPLPLSPQPTQVMVFALSDNNEQHQQQEKENVEQEPKPLPTDLNVTPQLQIPSVIETAPTPEIEKREDIDETKESLAASSPKNIPNPVDPIEPPQNIETETEGVAEQAIVDSEQKDEEPEIVKESKEIIAEIPAPPQVVPSETESSQSQADEHESEKNSEPENEEIKAFEEKVEQQIVEDDRIVVDKETIAESLVEEITQKAVEIVEQQQLEQNNIEDDEHDLPSPPPSPVDDNMVGISNGNAEDHTNGDNTESSAQSPIIAEESQESTHKENGVTHDASTEECLNGGIESAKTIEEMKAEHVEKNIPSAEEQIPAVVSATE